MGRLIVYFSGIIFLFLLGVTILTGSLLETVILSVICLSLGLYIGKQESYAGDGNFVKLFVEIHTFSPEDLKKIKNVSVEEGNFKIAISKMEYFLVTERQITFHRNGQNVLPKYRQVEQARKLLKKT